MEKEIKEKKEICKAPGCVRFGKEKHYICDPENYCRNCNKKKEYCVCDKMPKEIKEKIENILLEAWRGIGDYKTDGREFPRSDKLSDFADQILELFSAEKQKWRRR